jgi:hypothetical protein
VGRLTSSMIQVTASSNSFPSNCISKGVSGLCLSCGWNVQPA